ncbi:MAG: response regulator [Calothrix sp. SM1_5_4]|nr:response regulator [Calothrix sp. SM1_5_4]
MKHSILCVDDEVDNVDALERLFRRKYNVFRATSGKEALKVLKDNPVSLIVSDQRMPGMTGVELLAKSIDYRPDAVRVLLTGYTDIESVISAINSGQVYRYVTKPWDPVDLGNTIDKAIERYEMALELREKNAALEKALRELRSLDQAKSNFMILINHELKTPLTSMLSFIELLRESGRRRRSSQISFARLPERGPPARLDQRLTRTGVSRDRHHADQVRQSRSGKNDRGSGEEFLGATHREENDPGRNA